MNVIETDISGDINFFQKYIDAGEWVDINEAYADYDEYSDALPHRKPKMQYINHINEYDLPLKKYLINLFKKYNIKSKDFRCEFFLTKPGGYLPAHVDHMTRIAILVPLKENTGALVVEGKEYYYQNAVLLNTRVEHEVRSPTQDRLQFRVAIHDMDFKDLQL